MHINPQPIIKTLPIKRRSHGKAAPSGKSGSFESNIQAAEQQQEKSGQEKEEEQQSDAKLDHLIDIKA